MAWVICVHQFRGAFKVWKALVPRLTALCSVARADITVKMVVPTLGSCWERRACGRQSGVGHGGAGSEFVVVHMAGHGPGDQFTAQAVAEQFGKL